MSENTSLQINPVTEGILGKEILKFFFPLAGGSIVQQLYNMADAIIVGKTLGKAALASVGGSPAIIAMIVTNIIVGLSGGAAVVVSQNYGARFLKKVDAAIHTAITFSLILGAGITVVGLLFGRQMLTSMNTPAEILDMTDTYVRVYFIGIIPTAVYNMGSAIMRALGDSRRPFRYLIVCSVMNIVLDLLFVMVMDMGVTGAAAATVISQTVSAVLICSSLNRAYQDVRFSPGSLGVNKRMLRDELSIGLPGAMLSVVYGVTNVMVQAAINVLGTDTVAAWAAYGKADILFWSCNSALGIAAATFVAQNYGAGKIDRVKKSATVSISIAFAVCGTIMVVLLLFGRFFLAMFTSDADVIRIGTGMIRFLVPTYLLYIFIEVLIGALRGLGDVKNPTAATIISLFIIRLPWLLIVFPKHKTLKVLMFCYPAQWIFLAAFMIIYWRIRIRREIKRSEQKVSIQLTE